MKIIKIISNQKNDILNMLPQYWRSDLTQQLTKLNVIFTDKMINKATNSIDYKQLLEIKNKAKNFQLDIYAMMDLLDYEAKRYNILMKVVSEHYIPQDNEINIFDEENNLNFKSLEIEKKMIERLYKEIIAEFKSYKKFINKYTKLADNIKKENHKQHKDNIETKYLNDTILHYI